jgi:Lrp/AsnC family transcriptional regulator, leucine-responsive regulatory protein
MLDKKDIDILRVLINDSRSSYRSIGIAIGMSTNAAKTRVKRLISNGVIRQFFTSIDVAAFGYSKLCYLFIKDSKSAEETLSRIKLLGQLVLEVKGIGGTSLVGIAIRKKDEEKIQLLTEALKPALIQNLFIGQSSPLKLKLSKTDFRIMKCLLSNTRMEIAEMARQLSISSKTAGYRLAKMKENRIIMFNVGTDPIKMKGFIRFGMFVRLNSKASQKTTRLIQEVLDNHFVIALPMIHQEDLMNFQLVVSSIFEIDPALEKIESLDGVNNVGVFIPQRARMHQDWIMREIDERVNDNAEKK